jgi:hypothetical protein
LAEVLLATAVVEAAPTVPPPDKGVTAVVAAPVPVPTMLGGPLTFTVGGIITLPTMLPPGNSPLARKFRPFSLNASGRDIDAYPFGHQDDVTQLKGIMYGFNWVSLKIGSR